MDTGSIMLKMVEKMDNKIDMQDVKIEKVIDKIDKQCAKMDNTTKDIHEIRLMYTGMKSEFDIRYVIKTFLEDEVLKILNTHRERTVDRFNKLVVTLKNLAWVAPVVILLLHYFKFGKSLW